ncbi:hypothetical protein SESBI_36483 [Sesbania bispinosa]|nr:hypothetical protein SESBI_36483 [Sesbania bispinosa]
MESYRAIVMREGERRVKVGDGERAATTSGGGKETQLASELVMACGRTTSAPDGIANVLEVVGWLRQL